MAQARIKALDQNSVHHITSSQVVVDLQTVVKELVENALDAGATAIDVRIKDNGVKSVEVIDNGTGIAKDDYDIVALKHHTSKLSTFEDLTTVETFGFRGEALASLCAICESVVITTATTSEAPMGTVLELDRSGRVVNKDRRIARQRGTTVSLTGLFAPLPVRRKEFERHAKREYGKALMLLTAYALVPCTAEAGGVKLTVSHISESGKKSVQIQTDGSNNLKNSITALWGSKAMENVVPLSLTLDVEPDSTALKRRGLAGRNIEVKISGLVSKFAIGRGRASNDRQFFFVNNRPCNLPKVQKAFNEVYKTFNATQSPFIVANFTLPTDACDINVSPDKRTIFLHSEHSLVEALKASLQSKQRAETRLIQPKVSLSDHFSDSRSTFILQPNTATAPSNGIPSRNSRNKVVPEPIPSPNEVISIPSSDQLPSTQPHTLLIPSSDSVEEIPVNSPDSPKAGGSVQNHSSSRLDDHMSPPPLVKMEESDDEPTVLDKLPRKRRASRSPSRSPAPRPLPGSSRLKNPVQMVLSTTGAAWSLSKGTVQPSTKANRMTPSERPSAARSVNAKNSSTLKSTLSQFRRGGEADARSDEEDELLEDASNNNHDDGREEGGQEMAVGAKRDDRKPSRATSRSSRSSMRIDTPPDSPELVPETPIDEIPGNRSLSPGPVIAREGPRQQRSFRNPSTATPQVDAPSRTGRLENPSSDEIVIIDIADRFAVEGDGQTAEEIMKEDEAIITPMKFDIEAVTLRWKESPSQMVLARELARNEEPTKRLANDIVLDPEPESNPEELLSRVIQKEDFEAMEILGQFNLGFIIVRSRRSTSRPSGDQSMDIDIDGADIAAGEQDIDDLFIVDQHAADEKYNFETLQLTTRIESQKLIRARPMDFSASDRMVALENLEVLQKNGFELEVEGVRESRDVEEGAEQDRNGGQGQLLLVSQPVSKSTVFDMSDLGELLHLMQDKPAGTMVRCSKARAMFASRACRKSVMVGHPLTKAQMTSVIRHMSTMDQPWNCPHGRPTMRHLLRMNTHQSITTTPASRKVDWEKLK